MKNLFRSAIVGCSLALLPGAAFADPVGWPQPGGKGTDVVITYSFSNLFDGGFNTTLPATDLREATAAALAVWSRYAPLNFFEVPDAGPATGDLEVMNAVGPGATMRVAPPPVGRTQEPA